MSSKRVAAHIIRKPVVESAVCEVIENAGETSRVDLRQLQHMIADTKAPIDLETEIEVCTESAEPSARSTRLAHTVRRAESAPIVAPEPEPAATVEMAPLVAAVEPVAVPARDRTTIYAAAAFVLAAVALLVVVVI